VIFAPDNTPGLAPSPGRCRLFSELLVPSTPCGAPQSARGAEFTESYSRRLLSGVRRRNILAQPRVACVTDRTSPSGPGFEGAAR